MEEKKLKKKKEKAIHEKNTELVFTYSKELADEYYKLEEYEQALKEYKEAEQVAKLLNNKLHIAITNRMIGETLCAIGEFEKALEHQKIHLTFSREENNLIEEQRALATLGRTYFVKAESLEDENTDKVKCLELSRKYYLKSLSICERLATFTNLSQKQLSEMKSRLYLNLGLTMESKGDISTGKEYIAKAIHICKNQEIWEDLCRCFIAQGSLYLRHNDQSSALLSYDEALKVAERVENRILLSCEILALKSDVLVLLSDFNGAKQVLIKAYKLKTPDAKEREEIEKKLKTIVVICRAENKLLEVTESDHNRKRMLYETLGDCCVKLKSYAKAIECYIKMLESSKAMGLSNKELIPVYFSLSQTYKDNGQYDLALQYFEEELEIEKDNATEACKTMLNMIEVLELKKMSLDLIMEKYQQALAMAKKTGDFKIEATVLRNIISTQNEYGRNDLAAETQKELDILTCCMTDECSQNKSEFSDEDIGVDVDLDELSDINSDNEDDMYGREKHSKRKITKSYLIRRNEKGETTLHVASAKGNIQLMKNLIQQGHPVNIQDAAGWSPLHEACNHGQVDAAKILIDSGACIDDRGGPDCDGITPLHDAAACGHLDIIDMLLDNGASPLMRNNQGETALDCLIACRERVVAEQGELDSITLAHFNSVVSRLKSCLTKAGYTTQKPSSKLSTTSSRSQSTINSSHLSQDFRRTLDRSRKRLTPDSPTKQSDVAAKEYQNAIQALRHRNKSETSTVIIEPTEKLKVGALLTEEDVGEDWLEDDLKDAAKRPTKRRCENFVGQQVRTSKPQSSETKKNAPAASKPRWDDVFDDLEIDDLEIPIMSPQKGTNGNNCLSEGSGFSSVDDEEVIHRSEKKKLKNKLKYQKSLLSVGFKRFNPPSHSTQEYRSEEFTSRPAIPTETEIPASVPSLSRSLITPCNQSIKVRIEGKLFLVPIPHTDTELNINWLITEASRRYQNIEGVFPVLSLTTEDGALLDENDPVSIVLGKGEVHAVVMSWNLAPLVDRYTEACSNAHIVPDCYVKKQLDMCQASACLEIKDVPLSAATLKPALKAISYHQNLQKLCLSGVYLQDQGFKVVVDSISKLLQLRTVDFSVNNITAEGVSYFVLVLSKNSTLQTIEELDFSYNPLGEESIYHLSNLTQHLVYLRVLSLSTTGLTAQSLYNAPNFALENIDSLNLSYNPLEREGVTKFLSSLNSSRLEYLDMSCTGGSEVFRELLLFLDRGHLDNLKTLKISDLDIDDTDIEQIVESLNKAQDLSTLDLSCNCKITIKSHQVLSQLKSLKEINLAGCELLRTSHALELPFCELTLSADCEEVGFKEAPYNMITNVI